MTIMEIGEGGYLDLEIRDMIYIVEVWIRGSRSRELKIRGKIEFSDTVISM